MAYERVGWEDYPSTASPIDADNLIHMEDGIIANEEAIEEVSEATGNLSETVEGLSETVEGKQDTLTFDDVPTEGSNNPVKSNGVYDAILNVLPVDKASGNPAVITDAFGGACKSLGLILNPIQSGSGTPSPDNVRAISGSTSVEITVNDSSPIEVALGTTVYGGTAEVVSGEGSSNWKLIDLGDLTWIYNSQYTRFEATISDMVSKSASRTLNFACSCYQCIDDGRAIADVPNYSAYSYLTTMNIVDNRYTDADAFKTAVTGQKLAYPSTDETALSLTPTTITLLNGDNVVSVDADSVEVTYRADVAKYIDKKLAEGSQGNRSLSKGGSSEPEEEPKEEEVKKEETKEEK